jgi:hypothetical protein
MCQEPGAGQTLALAPDTARPGAFTGQFPVLKAGTYRLEISIPESEDERLSQTIKVRIPKLESETPQRNDALLSKIAKGTSGQYYVGLQQAVSGTNALKPMVELLKDKSLTTLHPETPDPKWKERWLIVILAILCGVLFLEWTLRRLVRLA